MKPATKSALESTVRMINKAAGFDDPDTRAPGAYVLDKDATGYALHRYSKGGGESKVFGYGRHTAKAMDSILEAYYLGMEEGQRLAARGQ